MVRKVMADGPQTLPEQPVLHLEIWIVRTLPADSPTRPDSPATPGGQFGKPPSTKNT
jgi:hypothetical protein